LISGTGLEPDKPSGKAHDVNIAAIFHIRLRFIKKYIGIIVTDGTFKKG